MRRFFDFMAREFPYASGRQTLETALVQAIVAHVYIELIHPFGDGNGRTGRLIEFWLLLRGGVPAHFAHRMADHYNLTRSLYYQQLKQAGESGELTAFLTYALDGLLHSLAELEEDLMGQQWRMAWQRHVYQTFEQHEKQFPEKPRRQRIRRLALLLPQGQSFEATQIPFLSSGLMQLLHNRSLSTLERDLQALTEVGLLTRENSSPARYRLTTEVLGSWQRTG